MILKAKPVCQSLADPTPGMKFVFRLRQIGQKRQLRCRTQKLEIDGSLVVEEGQVA